MTGSCGHERTTLVREIEVLRVGPDEVLIVHLPDLDDGSISTLADDVMKALIKVGLGERSLVFSGSIEFAVASRDHQPEGEPR